MTTQQDSAIQDGLDSRETYVILARNGRLGIHLGLRPHVSRIDTNTIWIGGRLRTAFDFDDMNHQTKKPKVIDLTEKQAIALLKKEYSGFSWMTGSEKRCSTTVGILIAAGRGDSKTFKKKWDEVDYVGALLDAIQVKIKQPITGVKGVKQAKSRCVNELTERYETRMDRAFYDPDETGNTLDDKVLGEISSLINEGAIRSYQSSVSAFCSKVSKEQAKAIA